MSYMALVLIVGILAFAPARGAPARPPKSPQDLYGSLKGPWHSEDDKSPLAGFWFHRNEKLEPPSPKALPWSVILNFRGENMERFSGEPARVEVDGKGLKITLPPAGEGEKRKTQTLHIQRDGKKLKVRVLDGPFEGVYHLKSVPSKQ